MEKRNVYAQLGAGLFTGGVASLIASTNNRLYEPVQHLLAVSGTGMLLGGLGVTAFLLVTAIQKQKNKEAHRAELRRQIGVAEELIRRWMGEDASLELASATNEWGQKVLDYLNAFDRAAGDQFVSSAGFNGTQFISQHEFRDRHRNWLEIRIFQLDRIIEDLK